MKTQNTGTFFETTSVQAEGRKNNGLQKKENNLFSEKDKKTDKFDCKKINPRETDGAFVAHRPYKLKEKGDSTLKYKPEEQKYLIVEGKKCGIERKYGENKMKNDNNKNKTMEYGRPVFFTENTELYKELKKKESKNKYEILDDKDLRKEIDKIREKIKNIKKSEINVVIGYIITMEEYIENRKKNFKKEDSNLLRELYLELQREKERLNIVCE